MPLATTSSIILFIFFFPRLLNGEFSIASTVLAKAVLSSLNRNCVSSSTKGFDILFKFFECGENSTYTYCKFCDFFL